MSRKLTYEQVKNFIEVESGSGCKLLVTKEQYTKSTDKLHIRCVCGNPFDVSFTTFKRQKHCSECGAKIRIQKSIIPYEEIRDFINGESGNGCILKTSKEEYINTKEKLNIKCKCGEDFSVNFHSFKHDNKRQCNKCGREKRAALDRLSYEEVKERFAKEGYTLLSKEYINNAQKLDVMCPEGHITQTDLSHFTGGKRCHFCKGGVVYTYEFVKNTIESEPGYKLISYAYTNVFTPIKIQCSEGHIYETHFTYWQQGFRCTVCSESSGEIRVKGYLDNNKYKYIYQYKFDDCKNKQVLPFDFGILDENGKLLFLIEYDGEYHYKPIDGQEMLEYQQMLDNIKNTYCLKNNIRLLRIPYWEINNIPKILDKEFNNKEFKIGA